MVNETEEFKAYTKKPVYSAVGKRDTTYLGRFTMDMLLNFTGFSHILVTIARGYMFPGKDVERARRALCAWCSIPTDTSKSAPPREIRRLETDFRELRAEFPELVDADGRGWLYRHVHAVSDFVRKNPDLVSKSGVVKAEALDKKWDAAWRKKVIQLQIPIFHPDTKGAFILRFDDVISDAAELGELRDRTQKLPNDICARIASQATDVPEDVLRALALYYLAYRPEDSEYVVLPVTNFDAYFGNLNFSKKWLNKLPETLFEKQTFSGICRYRLL